MENANAGKASVGIIAKDEPRVKSKVTSFLKKVGIVITDGKLSEITLKELNRMVENASMRDLREQGGLRIGASGALHSADR